ncbi:hypothetical protein Trydic_g10904 [Trypoxylus dichotomus]
MRKEFAALYRNVKIEIRLNKFTLFSEFSVTLPIEPRFGKSSGFLILYCGTHLATNDFDFAIYLAAAVYNIFGPLEWEQKKTDVSRYVSSTHGDQRVSQYTNALLIVYLSQKNAFIYWNSHPDGKFELPQDFMVLEVVPIEDGQMFDFVIHHGSTTELNPPILMTFDRGAWTRSISDPKIGKTLLLQIQCHLPMTQMGSA